MRTATAVILDERCDRRGTDILSGRRELTMAPGLKKSQGGYRDGSLRSQPGGRGGQEGHTRQLAPFAISATIDGPDDVFLYSYCPEELHRRLPGPAGASLQSEAESPHSNS